MSNKPRSCPRAPQSDAPAQPISREEIITFIRDDILTIAQKLARSPEGRAAGMSLESEPGILSLKVRRGKKITFSPESKDGHPKLSWTRIDNVNGTPKQSEGLIDNLAAEYIELFLARWLLWRVHG